MGTTIRCHIGAELRGLFSPALWVGLGALLITFLIAPQLPLRYVIDAGYEEGVGSDLPFLQGFNTAERDSYGTYRWTADGAAIRMPGVGRRPLTLQLCFSPVSAEVMAVGPQTIEILADGRPLATLPVIAAGSAQTVLVPPPTGGALEITLRTATFSPPGDPRSLGTPLDRVEVVALPGGPAAPDWPAALAWLCAAALAWLALRHALGGGDAPAGRLYGAFVALAGIAAILDPPHWAAGAGAALATAAIAYPLAAAVRAGLPPLARRLGVPLGAAGLGWLAVFCVVAFAMRYGGRLYPDSMHGDIGFHINRFNDAIWGLIFILSKNRGVDFPYPPGPYLLVAPFTLLGLSTGVALQLGAALLDSLSAAVVYAIASRIMSARAALLAAAIYVFTAATFMTTWWSFDTHIYSQFFHLLAVAALCWALEAWQGAGRRGLAWGAALFVLLSLVFLGHFGFLINTTLLVGLLAVLTWLNSWRGAAWARVVRWPLSLALGGAVIFAGACFYSAYIPLFLSQLATARAGGLSAVAERAPVSRAVMWDTLWRGGLITHFGIFPIPLALVGVGLLARESAGEPWLSRRQVALALMLGSLALGLCFAAMPFITLATNSPRWLMFLAWVVAVGAALATEALWRRGWAGRLAALAMGAVVLANTVWIWLSPMLWRIRPPEPF